MSIALSDRLAVEVPKRMRSLRKDARGYPIPWIVMIDKTGTPQFTINDQQRLHACVTKHLCAICGKRFDRHPITARHEMWFVGGARCFLNQRGGFIDPPSHLECAEYALRVCPFLAARKYAKRIDDKKLAPDAIPDGMVLATAEHMQPELPDRFGLGLCFDYRVVGSSLDPVFTVAAWHHIEWWHAGEQTNAPDSATP